MHPILLLFLALLTPIGTSCGSKAPIRKILRVAKSELPQENPRKERRPKQQQEPRSPRVEAPAPPPASPPQTPTPGGENVPSPPTYIPDGHPRLYFSQTELQGLQLQSSGTHTTLSQRIQGFGNLGIAKKNKKLPSKNVRDLPGGKGSWRTQGDILIGMTASALFHPNLNQRAASVSWTTEAMENMAGWNYWGPNKEREVNLDGAAILTAYSIAYDSLYSQFTPTQRTTFKNAIIKRCEHYASVVDSKELAEWARGFIANHNYINYNALLHGALAVLPEHPAAQKWIDLCLQNTKKVMDLHDLRGDGSDHEGPMYSSYGGHGLLPTLFLLHRFNLKDHFSGPWFQQYFNFLVHGSQKNFAKVLGFGDNYIAWGHGPEHLLFLLAKYTREPKANWFAFQVIQETKADYPYGKPDGATLFWEYVWYDPSAGNEAITTANTSGFAYFIDWGVSIFRRGWGARDTIFAVSASDPGGKSAWALWQANDPRIGTFTIAHDHPNDGGFIFKPGGQDFISGGFYEKPKRTALHSTWTFGPADIIQPTVTASALSRVWDKKYLAQLGRPKELGQSGEWNEWFGPAGKLKKERPETTFSTAKEADGMMFASVEIGQSYPKRTKKKKGAFSVPRLNRSFLLLPDDTLLIVDRVQTSSPVPAQTYFRSLVTKERVRAFERNTKGARLILANGDPWKITSAYPTGMAFETGKEIISIESARGEKHIRDWSKLDNYSVFLRASNPSHSGEETYIFLLHPESRTPIISGLQVSAGGVSLTLQSGSNTYPIKIGLSPTAEDRLSFLGFSGFASAGNTKF
ncbi:MAG: DUF4962 domain-containing protein [Planctomycetota bacterium]|nr:DUF4962 domain-containing protein [Planctomycetota bacterium]